MHPDDPTPGSKPQAPEAGHPPHAESSSLPAASGESDVVLLPVTPDKVFAFWEIGAGPAADGNRQEEASPPDRLVLRLHESGESGPADKQQDISHEVPIEPHPGSRYLNLEQAGSFCQAEIGYTDQEGRFVQTAQSAPSETPRPATLPEKARSHQQAGEAGPLPPPSMPTVEHKPVARPHPEARDLSIETDNRSPGLPPVEADDRSRPGTEKFLIRRRLAIFRHLAETVPLAEAEGLCPTAQAERPTRGEGIRREKNLTEICERKFVAGIFSR